MKQLGDLLIDRGILSQEDLEKGLRFQVERNIRLGEALVQMGLVSSKEMAETLAEYLHLPFFDLKTVFPSRDLLRTFPKGLALEYQAIPVQEDEERLIVALSDPTHLAAQDSIQFYLQRPVSFVASDPAEIQAILSKNFSAGEEGLPGLPAGGTPLAFDETDTVVHLVSDLLIQAVTGGASDIHLEPVGHALRVRYRLDGVCYERDNIPTSYHPAVISRVKLLSGMDIAENRIPQDGRIELKIHKKSVDFRVSSIPTKHGESIVLRILDAEGMTHGIRELGFTEADARRFTDLIHEPDGILLVTGPTGSGKTTTLYTALREAKSRDIKIIATEDPVEYTIDGISQIQVNGKVGLDFGRALRHILRHDPDVILVGEIRDIETAEIAMRSAMTGHKVYSTLHTNDAPSAINRLINIGLEPFLIAASLRTVIAQRLVRLLCSFCKVPDNLKDHQKRLFGIDEEQEIFRAGGCQRCGQTGYRGRTAIFEIMKFDDAIKALTLARRSSAEIREAALAGGMRSLREAGFAKVLMGVTSISEVLAVT